jgi:predicted component of type VI protein secretion system
MMPVARFTVLQGKAVVHADFVPPCFLIDGFAAPERVKKDLATTLGLIVRNTGNVLGKLQSKPRDIQERFPNRCYAHWAKRSQLGLAPVQADTTIGMVHPYELLRAVVQLAFTMDGIWRSMPERAELMDHVEGIGNWASLIRAQQATMDELMQLRYQHWDLGNSLLLCTRFLEQTRQAYAQLGELERFEVRANLRDVAPRTAEEIAPPAPPPQTAKRTFWVKRT